ncbi:HEAT repeat domain-containing protein [Streptomyces sp. NPDC085931]|uniref:HEAT repeat domain-containing protein n=1 Tax=Streptomyces sp. NPDC085931 TaxID=3365740 RepID=UPI0037CDC145
MRTVVQLVLLVSVAEAALCLLVLCVVRVVRNRRERALTGTATATRQLVVETAGGESPSARAALAALDGRSWQAVEPTVTRLLSRVKGGSHRALTDVLVQRGVVDAALAHAARPRSLRRARAATLLALAGPSLRTDPVRGPEARRVLHALLGHRSVTVRETAVRALGRLGDSVSAGLLLTTVNAPRPVAPGLIGDALVRIGPAAVEALTAAAGDGDEQHRALAVELLGLIKDRRAVPALSATLHDGAPMVRAAAAAALGRVGEPAAVAALADTVRTDPSGRVVVAAAEALGLIGDDSAVPALQQTLRHRPYRPAHTAARALLRLGPPGRTVLTDAARGADPAGAHAREALSLTPDHRGGPGT